MWLQNKHSVMLFSFTGDCGLGGVAFLLRVLSTEDSDQSNMGWQWCLGRLYMLLRLLEDHPTEFMIQVPPRDQQTMPLSQYRHYERILTVQRLCMSCLGNSHQKVGRMARRCFLTCARLQVHHPPFLRQVMELLDRLPVDMQATLRQRMHRLAAEYNIAQHVVCAIHPHESSYDSQTDSDSPQLFSTPVMSEVSSPRSVTPEPKPISVTVNNFIQGNMNFMPNAPPNSPARRHMPHHKSTSTQDDAESVVSDGASIPEAGSSGPSAHTASSVEGSHKDTGSAGEWAEEDFAPLPPLPVRGMPSGASATELGLTLTDDDDDNGDADDEAFTEANTSTVSSADISVCTSVHEDTSADTTAATADHETQTCPHLGSTDGLSECSGHATAASSSGTIFTEDLSDFTMSPLRPEEHISFKTEVASGSPQHFPGRKRSKEGNTCNRNSTRFCKCCVATQQSWMQTIISLFVIEAAILHEQITVWNFFSGDNKFPFF